MKKYYDDAKFDAAFDRCVDVMCQMIQKYCQQMTEKQEKAENAEGNDSTDEQTLQHDVEKVA